MTLIKDIKQLLNRVGKILSHPTRRDACWSALADIFHYSRRVHKQNKVEAISFCLVLVFYIFMMTFRLTYSPLWFDELVEFNISSMSLTDGEMYSNIIVTFQPPLYNYLMHFWLKLGSSDLWFRSFNIILGLIIFLCIYFTVRKLYGFKPAIFSLTLLSCCYQYIYCVQECAEYQLMLTFIALMILFYVHSLYSMKYKDMFLFVFFAVCAMYSQYGAVFLVVPFLIVFYFQTVFNKNRKLTVYLTILYVLAAAGAALPLYLLYAKIQLTENAIAMHTTLSFGISELTGLFTEIGRITAYLFNIPMNAFTNMFVGIFGVLLLICAVSLIIIKSKNSQNTDSKCILSLLAIFIAGYVMHYFLVIFHIYAMVHPGESGGFYARYSYFYIPLLIIVLVIVMLELKRMFFDNKNVNLKRVNTIMITVYAVIALTLFIPNILKNWHKSYDDVFCAKWVEGCGWAEPTYLFGQANLSFKRYITDYYGKEAGANGIHESQIDVDNLPDSFWLWRMSWGGEGFENTVNEARTRGFEVEVFYDYGTKGQLAHAIRK